MIVTENFEDFSFPMEDLAPDVSMSAVKEKGKNDSDASFRRSLDTITPFIDCYSFAVIAIMVST